MVEKDKAWVSDFGLQNRKQSIFRFDLENEKFEVISLPSDHSNMRQIHVRAGQIIGAEFGLDSILVIRTEN